jgi:hypothetical protein
MIGGGVGVGMRLDMAQELRLEEAYVRGALAESIVYVDVQIGLFGGLGHFRSLLLGIDAVGTTVSNREHK